MDKRKVVAALILCIVVCSFTGCNTKQSESETERMTITWLGVPWFSAGENDTYPQRVLEERYDINIQPIFTAKNDYAAKKQVLFAAGEIPDVIYELDPSDVQIDAENGFLLELPYKKVRIRPLTYIALYMKRNQERGFMHIAKVRTTAFPMSVTQLQFVCLCIDGIG